MGNKFTSFIPEVGNTYKLAAKFVSYYKALDVYVYPDHVGKVDALMQNTESGWTIVCHDIRQDVDGSIYWAYSSGGYFMEVK